MKMIWMLVTCFVCQLYALAEKDAHSSAVGVLSLFPIDQRNTSAEYLIARDRLRHGRILKRSRHASAGVINFTLTGSFDPDLSGIYYSKIKLGTPPREYNMLIDTGSEISCSSCKNCPRTNLIGVEMNFYDPNNSSSATVFTCRDPTCAPDGCNKTIPCFYSVSYADESITSGFYVGDKLYLDAVLRTSQITDASSPFIFGCSTSRSGILAGPSSAAAVDGILGFNQKKISIISQLYSRQISPKVFSHCLRGEGSGGGILVLGEVSHPSMVYSPLVPSMGNYYVYLQNIAINGSILPIAPITFETSTSTNRGTIFDSGTTLVYIVVEAYESIVKVINTIVSPSAKPIMLGTQPCYQISSSLSNNIAEVFPTISLSFAGGASMDLRPTDYLKQMSYFEGAATWCIYYVQSNPSLTVIGDAALKDRVVVYDLARQRIGWADYNCSLPLKVSSGIDKVVHPGAFDHLIKLILISYLFWIG